MSSTFESASAATLDTMVVRLMGDYDDYERMLDAAVRDTDYATREFQNMWNQVEQHATTTTVSLGEIGTAATTVGIGMAAAGVAISAVFDTIAVSSLQAAGKFEQTTIAFETMLGSASKTTKLLDDLTQFAAKTPFEMPEIEQAARGLVMFGERGDELMKTLNLLGNAAAGTSTDFGMVALVFNQIRGVGHLLTQDFRQLSTRGILSLQDIADHFHTTTEAAQAMLSGGKISFDDLKAILGDLSKDGGRFANLMEKQSHSLLGVWSTLKDDINIMKRQLGEDLAPAAKAVVNQFIEWADAIRESDSAFKPLISALVGVGAVSGPLITTTGGLLIGVGQLATGYNNLTEAAKTSTLALGALNAISIAGQLALGGLVVGAVGVAVVGVNSLIQEYFGYNDALEMSNSLNKSAADAIAANVAEVEKMSVSLSGFSKQKFLDNSLESAMLTLERFKSEVTAAKKEVARGDWFDDAAHADLEAAEKRVEEQTKLLKILNIEQTKMGANVPNGTGPADPDTKTAKAAEKYIETLKHQAETFGMTSREAAIYDAWQNNIAYDTIQAMKAQDAQLTTLEKEKKEREEAEKATKKFAQELDQLNAKLGKEVSTLEMEAKGIKNVTDELAIQKLVKEGATEEAVKEARVLLSQKNALTEAKKAREAHDKELEKGKKIIEQFMTPMEIYTKKTEDYIKLWKAGAFGKDADASFKVLSRAMREAEKELADAKLDKKVDVSVTGMDSVEAGTKEAAALFEEYKARVGEDVAAAKAKAETDAKLADLKPKGPEEENRGEAVFFGKGGVAVKSRTRPIMFDKTLESSDANREKAVVAASMGPAGGAMLEYLSRIANAAEDPNKMPFIAANLKE